MAVSNQHPDFKKVYPKIELTEDALEGEVRKEQYVPRLTGQSQAAWEAYVSRAAYYNVTERSLLALVGALLRKPYQVEGDEPVTDEGFSEFLQRCYRDLMVQGRLGIHVDFDEELGAPKLVSYYGEHIINWSSRFVVIEESITQISEKDEFLVESVPQWREMRLNDEGNYEVRIWRAKGREQYEVVQTFVPTVRGAPLKYIPFWFVTPYDNSDEVFVPPLYTLAELNIQHFKVSVDHGHGLHFTALPQPWIAGDIYTMDGQLPKTLAIGTDQVWHLTQGTSVGFLEFSGAGMGALSAQMTRLEEQMYSAGSRLLTVKRGVESAEALQLRAGSESAALVTMAQALENALNKALELYAEWGGNTRSVTLNKDFTASVLDPAEISVLLNLYTSGAITLDTLLKRLYDGELVEDVETESQALTGAEPAAPAA